MKTAQREMCRWKDSVSTKKNSLIGEDHNLVVLCLASFVLSSLSTLVSKMDLKGKGIGKEKRTRKQKRGRIEEKSKGSKKDKGNRLSNQNIKLNQSSYAAFARATVLIQASCLYSSHRSFLNQSSFAETSFYKIDQRSSFLILRLCLKFKHMFVWKPGPIYSIAQIRA